MAPLPASQSVLCGFIAYLANQNLSYATIKTYLSAVRYLHLCNGLPDPRALPTPRLDLINRGNRRENALWNISHPQIAHNSVNLETSAGIVVWVSWQLQHNHAVGKCSVHSMLLQFFFRMGEITSPSDRGFNPQLHLSFSKVAVDSLSAPTVLQVHLKQSKTDQFRQGIDVFVGKTGDDLCPVSACWPT